ncbi:hypothetical protein HAX54_046956 [Datura stramonium]|uniref:Protein kinase domain-containing protein n=1 Tax=Datura stramonium TaxID=4076 RepID=A0ABS8RQ45_DATST|nr:hypothetical protein [Datura stramonium]
MVNFPVNYSRPIEGSSAIWSNQLGHDLEKWASSTEFHVIRRDVSCYSEARADYLDYRKLRDTGCGDCGFIIIDWNRNGFGAGVKDGFVGDGFQDGDGCRKVSRCNPSRYLSGRCGGTTRIGVLVGGIIAGTGLMAALAVLCCCIEGVYGTVCAGKLHSDEWVAIKKLRHRDPDGVEQVMNEIKLLSSVADFGLSRFGMTDDSHISTAPQGTPGYVDPQYHQNYHLSDKSDVYSFGVVLVEIITALKVVDFSRSHSEINLAALAIDRIGKGRVDEIIDPFLEPHRDAWTLSSVHRVAELAFRCLAFP